MYIDIVPNRNSPPAILLRRSVRDGKKVTKETIANLSELSIEQAQAIRQILKGNPLTTPEECFDIVRSKSHGHVDAVLIAMQKLGFDKLLNSRPSKERDLVKAMVVNRILNPESKLAFSRSWEHSTLGELVDVGSATEDDLYAAMDWLYSRQAVIEKKLAKRHLCKDSRVLYDLSSSYFEGTRCPLGKRGYSRDKKRGKLQVNYGLLSDERGCPISIEAYPGNTVDSTTLLPQVEKLKNDFGLESLTIVGDRGMITETQITELKKQSGVDWITALKSGAIRKIMEHDAIQMTLFDEMNLFEFSFDDYPDERLVACRNPELAEHRKKTRNDLLEATKNELEKIKKMVTAGRLKEEDKIGLRTGRVINKFKMAKHFLLEIEEGKFEYTIDLKSVEKEAQLDGIYVIRYSSRFINPIHGEEAVRHYKSLTKVERAFRSIKTVDLEVRPIRHYSESRVKTHLFICMLAYYVKWHMMEAWRPLLFADEELELKSTADPVFPAQRSLSAEQKAFTKKAPDGRPVHSFQTLLKELATITRNTCKQQGDRNTDATFVVDTQRTKYQNEAFKLLKLITV